MAEEPGCVKVSKVKHACYVVIIFALASCGGGSSDSGSNTNSNASNNAAKIIAKNSIAVTSAFVPALLMSD